MTDLRPQWLPESDYPFHLRTIDLSTGPVTYIDEGDGAPLLFVHAGMWSFIFRDVITSLRSDHRCITFDFPGYGLTETDREVGVRDMATLTAELIEALDLHDLTIVAHDLGGPVALAAAAETRDRIAGLVLANTFAWTPDRPALTTMLRIMASGPVTAVDAATNIIPAMTATRFGVGRHLDRSGRRAFLGPFRSRAVRRRFHAAMGSILAEPDFTASVADAVAGPLNDLPALTIFGENNDPFGFQKRHAATFPDHEGIIVPRGNHFPMMDAPELFSDTVRDWHARKVMADQPAV